MEKEEQLRFIDRFKKYDTVEENFTQGCCYWFAVILSLRFPESEIMYDEIMNHFGTKIGDAVYDITGDVTDKFKWVRWADITDEPHRERIIKYCVNFQYLFTKCDNNKTDVDNYVKMLYDSKGKRKFYKSVFCFAQKQPYFF